MRRQYWLSPSKLQSIRLPLHLSSQICRFLLLFPRIQLNPNPSFLILYCCIIRMIRESADSSTSLINEESLNEVKPPSLPKVLLEKREDDHIEVGGEGGSAYPPLHQPFYRLIPLCLLLSFRQTHIIYFLFCCILQYFKFCSLTGEIFDTSVEFFILLLCILLQIHAKYHTYEHYTSSSLENPTYYQVWSKRTRTWEEVEANELKTGQIVKVEKYLDVNLRLSPANLLPIASASGNKNILIKTTRIDKREQYRKVKILKPLRKMAYTRSDDQLDFMEELYNYSIDYRFRSHLGSTFEAVLSAKGAYNSENVLFSNADIIPRGIPISTEEYIIGIVLMHTDHFQVKNVGNIFAKTNQINQILAKYLMMTVILNFFLIGFFYVLSFILTEVTTEFNVDNLAPYSYCFLLNLAASLCNVVYIAMYLMIHVHRMIDTKAINLKYKVVMKNRIKSIDELAQTDTLIMDDYFFLERPFNTEDFQYVLNDDAPLADHLSLIVKVIDESALLKEHMLGHTMPVIKYFRFKKAKDGSLNRSKIKIVSERMVDANCIEIKIRVTTHDEENRYTLRLNDRPVSSTLHKLRPSPLKRTVETMIRRYEQNHSLMFFIEIMKVEKDMLEMSNQYYNLYSVMNIIEDFNRNTLELITDDSVIKKYNIVMMTSKTWRYINYLIERGNMRDADCCNIMLEEKEEKQMNNIIKNHIKLLQQKRNATHLKKKHVLLYLNSSMITHLSRRNIRRSLWRLSDFCKYIIFYNCSQFEKEVCSANLFKIFPQHIFMSNYICDYNIFHWSNLSLCERGASSEMLATAVVTRFKDMKGLIFNEAIKSIQIVNCIINSHTFKNQLLIISHIVAFFLVYRGSIIDLGISYISELYFYYNFVFTSIPIITMIVRRSEVYIDQDLTQYLNVNAMILVNIKTIVFGSFITALIYALLVEEFVTNVFTAVLITCIFSGNVFLLYLDDSYQKKGQVVAIIVQIVVSIVLLIMIQLYNSSYFLFIAIGTNFDPTNKLFFLTSFLIAPGISFLILFSFSAGREIKIVENSREMELKMWEERDRDRQQSSESLTEENNTEIVLKVTKRKGKHISFVQED